MGGEGGDGMFRDAFSWLVVGAVIALIGVNATTASKSEGQLSIVFDTSIAPTYLDPAETTGIAALCVALCPPRRADPTPARQSSGPLRGGVLDGEC